MCSGVDFRSVPEEQTAEIDWGFSMNRMFAVGLVVIVGIVLFVALRDEEKVVPALDGAVEKPEGASRPEAAQSLTSPAVPSGAKGLREKKAKNESAMKRAAAEREAEEDDRRRREGIARVAELGYNALDAARIYEAWEDTEESMGSCRDEIKGQEGGDLSFNAMQACDRSHMDALYDDLGNPDDYRAALVAGDRITQVKVGIVDRGSYAESLGLEQGDLLVSWDGRPVFDPDDWRIPQQRLSDPDAPIIMEFMKPNGEIYQVESPGGRTGASMRAYK